MIHSKPQELQQANKPLCQQELRIPFRAISCSEPNDAFRSFIAENHTVPIFHRTMQDQIRNEPNPVTPDYLVMGTPCNPFSLARSKRFHEDSVQNHGLYKQTFEDAFQLLEKYQPVTATMEQSDGFDRPISSSTEQTPLRGVLEGGMS